MVTNVDLTITGVLGNYSSVSVDDVFQFTAIYDDASTHFLANETQSICLTTHVSSPGVDCVNSLNASGFNFLSNASLNFIMMFDTTALLDANGSFYDRNAGPAQYTYQRASAAALHFWQMDDAIAGQFDTSTPGAAGQVHLYYRDGTNEKGHPA